MRIVQPTMRDNFPVMRTVLFAIQFTFIDMRIVFKIIIKKPSTSVNGYCCDGVILRSKYDNLLFLFQQTPVHLVKCFYRQTIDVDKTDT